MNTFIRQDGRTTHREKVYTTDKQKKHILTVNIKIKLG